MVMQTEMSTFLDACAKDNDGLLSALGAHLTGLTKTQLKSLSKSAPVQGIGVAEFKRAFVPVHHAFTIFCQFDTDGDRQLNLVRGQRFKPHFLP